MVADINPTINQLLLISANPKWMSTNHLPIAAYLRLQPTTNGPLIDDHRLEDKTTNDNQLWSIIETNDP